MEGTASNRSLERGLAILRCFKPGLGALGNAEIVERTGLPKATVSRLTKTLVNSGFLRREPTTNAFKLSFSVLSLAHAVMLDSRVAHEALPLMEQFGVEKSVNVGLSTADGLDMVYLHVVHGDPERHFSRIEPGHRKAIEANAIGRAYLGGLSVDQYQKTLEQIKARHESGWPEIAQQIDLARRQVESLGYCARTWDHGTQSVAMPLVLHEGAFVINVSFSTKVYSAEAVAAELAPRLLEIGVEIKRRCRQ